MHPLEAYLQDLTQTRTSGANVKELSFYPALKDLFDAAGKTLKPKVRCVISLKNQGAGLPDGGLFTLKQLRKVSEEAIFDQTPERGAIEVKSPADDLIEITQSEQVTNYAQRYGLVLVTNLRAFALVKHQFGQETKILEKYVLASDEETFWKLARRPRSTAQEHGERLMEFLKRALLYQADLTDPKDLAWFLASYARDAYALLNSAGDLPTLSALRQSMQQALNMEFADQKGEHFFRSTLIQTLFYGIFSAWVLWHHENPAPNEQFDWRLSAYKLKVPVIQSLFHQLSDPRQMKALGLTEYLELTGTTLNRVNRAAFFEKFDEGQAVQYFYEPFLQAYDPELRKQLGVWYTPPEIVQYMVERVDRVLREELDLPDGLADPNVYVLDPCCGTGAYLLEVLKRIARTLKDKGEEALIGYDLKQAATQRVFGFEILPAPFVIAHLQAGLFLQQHGAPLADDERAGVYLTNSLTGWEPPQGPKQHLPFPELEAEQDAAARVKRETPILVILGNPPYNAFAGVAETDEGKQMVQVYKDGLREEWDIKKYNLDDLYVRFFRLAERRIAEKTGRGVVSFISNHSWTKKASFVVLRQHLLESFDKFWVENMHGNRKISEYAPDGRTSQTIFAVQGFSPGIKQGITISLWVKNGKGKEPRVLFRDDLTEAKAQDRREHLLATLKEPDFEAAYQTISPRKENRFSFRPMKISESYLEWPRITDLAEKTFAGVSEDRRKSLISIDIDVLKQRMQMYFDPKVNWQTLTNLGTFLTTDLPRFDAKKARSTLQKAEQYDDHRLIKYTIRPFDTQWCYYSPVRPLWREPRPDYWNFSEVGTSSLITRFNRSKDVEGSPFFFTKSLSDYHLIAPNATVIPLIKKTVHDLHKQTPLFDDYEEKSPANLSNFGMNYMKSLDFNINDNSDDDKTTIDAYELVWYHSLAIGYSPAYLSENFDGIGDDYPRIPLPVSRDALIQSAALGKQIAALLDTESHPPEVLSTPEFTHIAALTRIDDKQINPQEGDLALTAGWGHAQSNAVMPGKGKVAANAKSLDIYLNDRVYWKDIPEAVWNYTIGGYQVIKKWLSYRESKIMGRDMTVEEAREVTNMAKRIAGLIALENELDENYHNVKANCRGNPIFPKNYSKKS